MPVLLLFLSAMMVSRVKYPTFKKVNLQGSILYGNGGCGYFDWLDVYSWKEICLPVGVPVLFIIYLLYGFVRPYIPRGARKDIEENCQ